jgi:hypothetical protein
MRLKSLHLELPGELYDAFVANHIRVRAAELVTEQAKNPASGKPLPLAAWIRVTPEGKQAFAEMLAIAQANPTRAGSDQANAHLSAVYTAYRTSHPKRKPGRPKLFVTQREAAAAARAELAAVIVEYLTQKMETVNAADLNPAPIGPARYADRAEAAGVRAHA